MLYVNLVSIFKKEVIKVEKIKFFMFVQFFFTQDLYNYIIVII